MSHVDVNITWKNSDKARVCTATAYSKDGKLLGKIHINISLIKSLGEFYRMFDDSQIEQAAEKEVKFMLDHPELYQ
jgi:hypothetical protein